MNDTEEWRTSSLANLLSPFVSSCVLSPADNYETALKNEGCYVILVNYTDENGKNKDKYFTFMN